MQKLIISILISGVFILAFTSQKQKGGLSLFEYKFESKEKLIAQGFFQDSSTTLNNKKLAWKNNFTGIFNDTIIKLSFSENTLRSKIIFLKTKQTDTSALLKSLYKKGFEKLPAANNKAKFDLINSKINEHYIVYINSYYITFENIYSQSTNKIPQMDSIKGIRGN